MANIAGSESGQHHNLSSTQAAGTYATGGPLALIPELNNSQQYTDGVGKQERRADGKGGAQNPILNIKTVKDNYLNFAVQDINIYNNSFIVNTGSGNNAQAQTEIQKQLQEALRQGDAQNANQLVLQT